MDPRESSLPKWAQSEIASLRLRLRTANEPLVIARRELEALKTAQARTVNVLEAIKELLFAARHGGHRLSAEIISVLEGYEIFPNLDSITLNQLHFNIRWPTNRQFMKHLLQVLLDDPNPEASDEQKNRLQTAYAASLFATEKDLTEAEIAILDRLYD